jgi:sugar O-acyltransferase (sialic acid O-acetyltransferase NeuD family)
MRFLLWGSSGHAKVLADLLGGQGNRAEIFVDADPAAVPAVEGVPIIHGRDAFLSWAGALADRAHWRGVVAIGGGRGVERLAMLDCIEGAGIVAATLIHPSSVVSPKARVGDGCQILAGAILTSGSTIGRGTILNHGAQVDHECSVGSGVHLAPRATLCGCVEVGDFSFIGAGAVVLPRLKIGRGAIIGAGAVVTKDVPPGVTVAGNPARNLRI